MSIISRDQVHLAEGTLQPRSARGRFWPVLLLLLAGLSLGAGAPPPGQATLLTPAQGAVIDRLDFPQFSWRQGDPQAEWFQIYISHNGRSYTNFWLEANTLSATNIWVPTHLLPAGPYTWWVRTYAGGLLGGWSQAGNFTILGMPNQITGISPQGTTESNPTLTYAWYIADTYALWYELYIMKNGAAFYDDWHTLAPDDLVYTPNGSLGQLSLTLRNQPSGSYTWWVRGWSPDGIGPWSATMAFTNQLPPAGSVTLLTPAPGEVVADAMPEFSWQNNGGATCDWLWLYRNGSLYSSHWLVGTNGWASANTLPVGSYSWWVGPWNPDGFGSWSGSSFTVPSRVPGSITQLAPSGISCDNSPMHYSWNADANATWYQLVIIKNSSTLASHWYPVSASLSQDPSVFQIQVTEPHGSGAYSWWVRGWSPDGLGPWTSIAFTVFDSSTVLPFEGSSWYGPFTTSIRVVEGDVTNTVFKTHQLNILTFSTNLTFTGSGWYILRTNYTTNIVMVSMPETYTGTYTFDADTVTASGTQTLNSAPAGEIEFSFSLDLTRQHITSGTWTDVWDANQAFDIFPDSGPYVTYIRRICGPD